MLLLQEELKREKEKNYKLLNSQAEAREKAGHSLELHL